jgi:GMP synthase-like glutamine amidotransferase
LRALAIIHQDDTGLGVFGEVIRERGIEIDEWRPFLGEPARAPADHGLVVSLGGAMNVTDDLEPLRAEERFLAALVERGVPVFGICLGAQLIANATGGRVHRTSRPEIGWHEVTLTQAGTRDPVFGPLPPSFEAFEWHSYQSDLPAGSTELASSDVCEQAYRLGGTTWAMQFHAEVTMAIVDEWIDGYAKDGDAVAIGLDPEALRAETTAKIAAWNDLGRGICARFLDAALKAESPA